MLTWKRKVFSGVPEPSAADKAAWKDAGAKLWDEYAAADKYSKELIDILRKEQK
ncbi:hypothetical protein [Marinomonas rhodophyticola]|uniref:hypothetical protein n=1 Tax=Marinomonas rhodophyticola TaxID=2992803 RepID=UPI002AA2B262|nr:hypothetical protein [Marinomonas sp. KJ51-3]